MADLAECLDSTVDVGSRTLAWAIEVGEKPGIASALGLLRTVLERLDGMSSVVRCGQVDSMRVIFRAEAEAYVQLKYLLMAEPARRDRQYRFAIMLQQRRSIKRYLDDAANGRADKGRVPVATKALAEVDTTLSSASFAQAKLDFDNRSKRDEWAPWYSYAKGPKNLKALCDAINESQIYTNLYGFHSQAVHANEGMDAFISRKGRKPAFKPLRKPDGVQDLTGLGAMIGMLACQRVCESFFDRGRTTMFLCARARASYLRRQVMDAPKVEFTLKD